MTCKTAPILNLMHLENATMNKVEIHEFGPVRMADEMSAQMWGRLEHSTPAEMGFPGMTVDELIASERQSWLDEESARRE